MDLKQYYLKIRQVEATLSDADVVLVSIDTPDGGKAGVMTEVPRELAARYIAEGRARVASAGEAGEFHGQKAAARKDAERLEASRRIQVVVLPESEAASSKAGVRQAK